MLIYNIFGTLVILYGLRIILKGRAQGSTARVINGIALIPVGMSQFFHHEKTVGTLFIAIGVALFVWSMFLLKQERGGNR